MEQNIISKNNNRSGKTLGAIHLGAITLLQVKHIRNLDLLNSGATDHANKSRDMFINFHLLRKEAYIITRKRIISCRQGDIVKNFEHSDVMFTNVLHIPTLVNNLFSMSWLCHQGWDINMKHFGETIFLVNNKVIGHTDKNQTGWVYYAICRPCS